MAIYQASKQLTKFIISGMLAVTVDFTVYFALSQYLDPSISKAISFCSGMLVTYNMNKFWTWKQPEKDNKRLMLFSVLYAVALFVNVGMNNLMLDTLPNHTLNFSYVNDLNEVIKGIVVGVDKLAAFVIATGTSVILTYIGQKYWLFREKD
ncbi:GtrA family protein [Bacteroidia bacterium]|nr:GtrA family protein [Bacteroidia bacterium]MDB4107022.1 GtrA family protein [Bacteroidia bacterium]MDB9882481.1 GtrA family protein [Bacteroidia bacterium]